MLKRFILPALFVAAESVLYYLLFQTGGRELVRVMFLSIVLCFLFALLYTRKHNFLRTAALAFTVCADWCLVVCDPVEQLYGMCFFLVVQVLYAVYLYRTGKHKALAITRLALIAAIEAVAFIVLGKNMDPLAGVSVAYYALLVTNIIDSFTQSKKDLLFPIGLLLFVMCDTVIGLQVASQGYLPIAKDSWLYTLLFPSFNLAWVFYLPSQVLIALSQRKRR